jgi:hypothetical protein
MHHSIVGLELKNQVNPWLVWATPPTEVQRGHAPLKHLKSFLRAHWDVVCKSSPSTMCVPHEWGLITSFRCMENSGEPHQVLLYVLPVSSRNFKWYGPPEFCIRLIFGISNNLKGSHQIYGVDDWNASRWGRYLFQTIEMDAWIGGPSQTASLFGSWIFYYNGL